MILFILVIGFILRLIKLDQSLWLDEAINVIAARELGFWHYVTGYPIGDFHPPGYFAILWVWGHIFGFSEVAVRVPSIIFGLLTIYLVYQIAKEMFSKRVGLIASFLLAIAPLHIYYSQEARMYSFAAFAASLCFYFFQRLLSSASPKNIFLYGVSLTLLLYSDYVAYFVVISQLLYLLVFEKGKIKSFLGGLVIGFIGIAPWLVIFPTQLTSGIQTAKAVPGWKEVVGGNSLKSLGLIFVKTVFGRISFENKQLYGVLVIVVASVYGLIFLNVLKNLSKKTWMLVFWVVVPIVTGLLISFVTPVLSYFRMLFILPGFYILLGVGIDKLSYKRGLTILQFFVFVSFGSLLIFYTNPKFQRENWRELSSFLNGKSASNSIVLFEDNSLPAPYKYYDSKMIESHGALEKFPAEGQEDLKNLKELTKGRDKIYLVEYLVDISDKKRLVKTELINLGYVLEKTYDFPSLGFIYEYTK